MPSHPPTRRRLASAWARGEVAISPALVRATVLCVALVLLPSLLASLSQGVQSYFEYLTTTPTVDSEAWRWAQSQLLLTLPFLASCALAAAAIGLVQTRGNVAPKRLIPSLERFNPYSGLFALCSPDRWARLLMSQGSSVVIAIAVVLVLKKHLRTLPATVGSLPAAVEATAAICTRLAWTVAIASLFLALAELAIVRIQWWQRLKMSDAELKQDRRDTEANEAVAAARAQIHRSFLEEGAASEAASATLFVRDDSGWLFGLRYDEDSDDAPVVTVIARGDSALARAREAEAEGLQVFDEAELVDLLRLHRLGQSIPPAAFDRTAELIATLSPRSSA